MATLKSQNVYQRIPYCVYLLVSVMWTGTGSQGFQWLRMVDRKVILLRNRISDHLRSYSSANSRPYLIPNRLVRPSSTDSGTYEGHYIICFPTTAPHLVQSLHEIYHTWLLQFRQNDTLSNGKGFIHAEVKTPDEIGNENLSICRRVWPEKAIKSPTKYLRMETESSTTSGSPTKGGSSDIKPTATSFSETKGFKLRPAHEVLNRLRHDPCFNFDEWVIGYVDRHSAKMQEKNAAD